MSNQKHYSMTTEDMLVWLEYDVPAGCETAYAAIASKLRAQAAQVEELSSTAQKNSERLRAAEELAKLLAYYESELSHELLDALANYRAAGGMSLDQPPPGGGE